MIHFWRSIYFLWKHFVTSLEKDDCLANFSEFPGSSSLYCQKRLCKWSRPEVFQKTGLNKFVKFKNLLFNEIEGGSGAA